MKVRFIEIYRKKWLFLTFYGPETGNHKFGVENDIFGGPIKIVLKMTLRKTLQILVFFSDFSDLVEKSDKKTWFYWIFLCVITHLPHFTKGIDPFLKIVFSELLDENLSIKWSLFRSSWYTTGNHRLLSTFFLCGIYKKCQRAGSRGKEVYNSNLWYENVINPRFWLKKPEKTRVFATFLGP